MIVVPQISTIKLKCVDYTIYASVGTLDVHTTMKSPNNHFSEGITINKWHKTVFLVQTI